MYRRVILLMFLAFVTAKATVAHGENDDVRTVTITATEFAFLPSTVKAAPGTTLRLKLVNRGAVSHNLTIPGVDTQTATVQGDRSDLIKLEVPASGTLEFYCSVPGHRQAGMTGKIIVSKS